MVRVTWVVIQEDADGIYACDYTFTSKFRRKLPEPFASQAKEYGKYDIPRTMTLEGNGFTYTDFFESGTITAMGKPVVTSYVFYATGYFIEDDSSLFFVQDHSDFEGLRWKVSSEAEKEVRDYGMLERNRMVQIEVDGAYGDDPKNRLYDSYDAENSRVISSERPRTDAELDASWEWWQSMRNKEK